MTAHVANLSCAPLRPEAGQGFRLTAELEAVATVEVTISLEKQRILANAGGFLELRPTGPKYFQIAPQPITVKAGQKSGTSEAIVVRTDAMAEPGEAPVAFPENLLFSAFVGQLSRRFACTVVPVSSGQKS
jgi:hypothetical protein